MNASPTIAIFAVVDVTFFLSNITKVADGGWFPLLVAGTVFIILTTWAKGRALMRTQLAKEGVPMDIFIKSASGSAHRVNGTAIFLSVTTDGVPAALLHNLKHNQVLHDRVIILTVKFEETPYVEAKDRIVTTSSGHGFYHVTLRYGFMEDVDVPRDLQLDAATGGPIDPMRTSYFLGRQKLIASQELPGMALWREHLFAWMLKTSVSAMDFFKLPTNRVVELGSQLRI